MDNTKRLEIFRAQTTNVRTLKQARKQITRTINLALRKGNLVSAQINTKILILVFCAWVEASFSKLIHTPYGFSLDEIKQIKKIYQRSGLGEAWQKCLELGLKKIPSKHKSSYVPNIRQKVSRVINKYVVEPSLIRNKIAHGQWKIALNRANNAVNNDISKRINNIDLVITTIWFEVYQYLSQIIETLIESPNRIFHRHYWQLTVKLEDFLKESGKWNINAKIKSLKRKTYIK